MAGLVDTDRSTPIFPRVAVWGGLALAAVILVSIGSVLGRGESAAEWHEGSAIVGADQASINVDGDDWTYGVAYGVAWIDKVGTHHESDWPECLDVPVGSRVEGVRFATIDVGVDGMGWREVVLVDCQQPRR